MTVNTHCLPNGSLGTGELAVPAINSTNIQLRTPTGSKRGVAVFLHGVTPSAVVPNLYVSTSTQWDTLSQNLVTDGWVTISPPYTEDGWAGSLPITAIPIEFTNDTGHGTRYLASWLHEWDHIVNWAQSNYGANVPIIVVGGSWGGWHALQICKNKLSTIAGYAIFEPVTLMSLLTVFGWNTFNTTGADTLDTQLNACTVPGMIGWGTNDTLVGFTHTQNIYNNASGAGMPITSYPTTNTHGMLDGDVAAFTNFVTGNIDPTCPAVF